MNFKDLFEHRLLIGDKLKDCIRVSGFSKVSFAKKAEISDKEFESFLNGDVTDKQEFDRCIRTILAALNMSADDIFMFKTPEEGIEVVYSQNASKEYENSALAKRQFGLLKDILNLCNIYYEDCYE